MSRTQRLDRKALKQDAFVNFMARATDYVNANANMVLGIAAAVVVAIVLLVFWSRGRTDSSSASDLQFSRIVRAYNAGAYADVLSISQEVSTGYQGTRAAVMGEYMSGQAHLQLGNFPEAERAFRAYISASEKVPFYADSAQLGLAASLDGQGRFGEAAQIYMTMAEKLPEPLASDARLDAARSYRAAGSLSQARSLLEQVKEMGNARSRDAGIELAILEGLQNATPSAASLQRAAQPTEQQTPEANP